jgi:hypothetical protein
MIKVCQGLVSDETREIWLPFIADAQRLVKELAGPRPSAVEQTLSEMIGVNWLQSRLLYFLYGGAISNGLPIMASDHLQRSITRAEGRAMRGLRHLSSIRGLRLRLDLLKFKLEREVKA